MKAGLKKGIFAYAGIFLLFVAFRLLYGYVTYDASPGRGDFTLGGYAGNMSGLISQNEQNQSFKYNKASAKRLVEKDGSGSAPGSVSVEQKFEKVSTMRSKSHEFDAEQKKIRETVSSFNAIIQYERSTGLKGSRDLDLVIGVQPEKFDAFVEKASKIGKLESLSIDKIDKTNEYRDLKSKRKTFEDTITSLSALKNKGGRVEEYIQLENKILEIKKQIQDLGVKLGEYDAENELCTVKFYLYEKYGISYSFIRSLKMSIEWAVKLYLMLTISAFLALAAIMLGTKIVEKFGLIDFIRRNFLNSVKKKK
jgi:hypothetical protein